MKLIGIAGTNGSGKDTAGQLLAERHNFLFVSVSDFLREEARRRGLPVTREVLRTISTEWRREFGLGVLVDREIEQFKSYGDKYAGVVACPMRNTGETQHLKDLGGTLIWVDADQHVRYERIRKGNRGRAGEDDKTFEQFVAEEQVEMQHLGDAATLNVADVKELADVTVVNDSDNLEAFARQIEQTLDIKD